MARLMSQLVLSLVDRVTAPARKAAQSVRGIVRAVSDVSSDRLRAIMDANTRTVRRLRSDLVDAGGTAVALAMALRRPIAAARAYETVLTDIGQKADLSRQEQLRLGAAIRALGPQVNRSAQELAGGVDILAGFGLTPDRALDMMRPIGIAATAYRAEISDLAASSYAAFDNLKVPIDEIGKALAAQALAGKEGAFELKDMAQYFPSLTASAQALGQTGVPAVADLAAALQIVRKGAGNSAEAATNLSNVLQKINAPLTRKKFAKFGIDLESSLKAAAARGMTPIEAIAEITNRALKGDLAKIGDLFEDAQVQKGLRPLIQNLEEYRRIRASAAGADEGLLTKDFDGRLQDGAAKADAFRAKVENLAISFGTALLPGLNAVLDLVGPLINGVSALAERFPWLAQAVVGAVAAVIGLRVATLAFRFGKVQMIQGLAELGLGLLKFRAGVLATATAIHNRLLGSIALMVIRVRMGASVMAMAFRGLLAASGIGLLILAAGWVVQHWSGVVSFFRGFGRGFMAAIGPVRPALEPLIQGVKTVVGWVRGLIGDKGEDWTEWGVKAGAAVGNFVTGAVKWIGSLVDWFQRALKMAWDLAKWTPAGLVVQAGAAVARAAGGKRVAGRRELGGDVLAGQSYLVGERRPEVFTPSRSGRIDAVGRGGGNGAGGQGRPIVFAPRLNITATDADPRAVAQVVLNELRREWRRAASGSHSDGVFA